MDVKGFYKRHGSIVLSSADGPEKNTELWELKRSMEREFGIPAPIGN